jgi:uncharacterized protein YpiB (UPF0302 family)
MKTLHRKTLEYQLENKNIYMKKKIMEQVEILDKKARVRSSQQQQDHRLASLMRCQRYTEAEKLRRESKFNDQEAFLI